VDDGQIPVDELHEILLEAEQTLRETDEQLPEPLTLSSSLTELRALQTRMLGSILSTATAGTKLLYAAQPLVGGRFLSLPGLCSPLQEGD